ncbi:MAG: hypothetical protein A2Y62_13255 [Candidatus Fischerbacteria bacterium RBG_13_37_8]|uniref:Glycosyltransferase RgtA/B/C/D-like domain-containing protein n=1 Tax=Candidatus Fischerbacteria bacterium RBG_13_37_8 TaxID=1817863 RepID=A0A1F5VNA4_9BACT|nr:MAG: hypothetical protein A2Y62_13255 [Candidatus Fischerbacteria bacterium RBG_13_37_8]
MNKIKQLLLIAFIIRLILPIIAFLASPVYENFYIHYDSEHYISLAKEIAQNGRFYFANQYQLYRTPGYPLFLVPAVLSGNVEWTTIFLQIILSCGIIYLVYNVSLLLFKNTSAAYFSALLYTFEPLSILYCSRIMSETLFTFLTYLFLYLLLCYFEYNLNIYLYLSSIVLVFAIYVRTVLYYFPVILIITAIIYIIFKWNQRKKYLLAFSSFFGIIIILVGAWHVRNGLLTGYWGFSIISDVTIYLFHGSSVIAEKQNIYLLDAQKQLMEYNSNLKSKEKLTLAENYKRLRQEGIRIILNNPLLFLKAYTKGLFQLMFDAGTADYLHLFHYNAKYLAQVFIKINQNYFNSIMVLARSSLRLFMLYSLLMLILLLYIVLAGRALFTRKIYWKRETAVFFIMLLYVFLVSGGVLGNARYRHPIMPGLSILAGYSLHNILLKLHKPAK